MKITAMPSLCDSTDFGLTNESYNRKTGLGYLKRNPILLKVLSNDTTLYKVGDNSNGFYFAWNTDLMLITYFMQYKKLNKNLIGVSSITQTSLWRIVSDAATKGITYEMIFDILLHKYPAILSDKLQTDDGQRFWLGLLDYALLHKYSVGLVDFNNSAILPVNSNSELRLWSTDDSSGPWSFNSLKHQGLRFIIYRK